MRRCNATKFEGELEFLSNMFICQNPVGTWTKVDSIVPYNIYSVEVLYQLHKLRYMALSVDRDKLIKLESYLITNQFQPRKCKVALKKYNQYLVEGWNEPIGGPGFRIDEPIKLRLMHDLVTDKFDNNPELMDKLKSLPYEEIVEWNDWNDKYWGKVIYIEEGKNHLGRILTGIKDRDENPLGKIISALSNLPKR